MTVLRQRSGSWRENERRVTYGILHAGGAGQRGAVGNGHDAVLAHEGCSDDGDPRQVSGTGRYGCPREAQPRHDLTIRAHQGIFVMSRFCSRRALTFALAVAVAVAVAVAALGGAPLQNWRVLEVNISTV